LEELHEGDDGMKASIVSDLFGDEGVVVATGLVAQLGCSGANDVEEESLEGFD
jgi:hypothetical protein